ncbi:hypothetical protein PHISCL_06442 [Aspergillus sclerotialis]|uniref:Uncharacterized protein n=1 Tax=Aspergillus sclerotialis TaxID=2070753 RepID=A0A3A2ZDK9_9EURO|nr:hypothetical protein PHISCL_06442 [Aspergillus sclerotialis]
MSQDQFPSGLEELDSFTVDHTGQEANFTLNPSLFDLSLDYKQPSSEPCDFNSLGIGSQFADSSTSLPTSLGFGSDGDTLQSSRSPLDCEPGISGPGRLLCGSESDLTSSSTSWITSNNPAVCGTAPEPDWTLTASENSRSSFDGWSEFRDMPEQYCSPRRGRQGLPRRKSRYLVRQSGGHTGPIYIPNSNAMDPMERWRESPPEDEPASMSAILSALENMPSHQQPDQSMNSRSSSRVARHNVFRFYRRAPSTVSGESSSSSKTSAESTVSLALTGLVDDTRSHGKVACPENYRTYSRNRR